MNYKLLTFALCALLLTEVQYAHAGPDTLNKKTAKHTYDYLDQDIRLVLREIADTSEINLIIPDTLKGRASGKLTDVTWEQAFRVLLEPIGWGYRQDGDVIILKPDKTETASSELPTAELLSSIGAMQATMSKQLLRDRDYAEALAEFHWNLYSALLRKGFSKAQALQIVSSDSQPRVASHE